MNRSRTTLVLAGIAVAIGLFVVLRPSGDDEDSAAAQTSETTSAETSTDVSPTATEPQPPSATTRPVVREHAEVIRIENGKAIGGLRGIEVEKGTHVTLVVTADVEDEVHVHGLDKSAYLEPGVARTIKFVARIPGRFEIELERRGLQIADLEVMP